MLMLNNLYLLDLLSLQKNFYEESAYLFNDQYALYFFQLRKR